MVGRSLPARRRGPTMTGRVEIVPGQRDCFARARNDSNGLAMTVLSKAAAAVAAFIGVVAAAAGAHGFRGAIAAGALVG